MVREFARWQLTLTLGTLLWFPGAIRAQEPTPLTDPPPVVEPTGEVMPTPVAEPTPINDTDTPTPVGDTDAPPPMASEGDTEEQPEATEPETLRGTQPVEIRSSRRGQEDQEQQAEIIRERHANTALKIERHVVQDADGNYINHGSWRWWDDKGNLVAQGQFNHSQRHGTWTRWLQRQEVKSFQSAHYTQFAAPFLSQATFFNGKLDGTWTIFDSQHRKVCEINFEGGERQGLSAWFNVKGQKIREIDFVNGEFHGRFREWNAEQKLTVNDTYEHGSRIAARVTNRPNTNAKQSAVTYRNPRLVTRERDDFWTGTFATFAPQGTEIKQGPWTAWHENGQVRVEGTFENDVPTGHYVWSYTNGQRQIEGGYRSGKQHGTWTWWHANGMKQIQGEYADGVPTGKWVWWKIDGKLAQKMDLNVDTKKLEQATLPNPELLRPLR